MTSIPSSPSIFPKRKRDDDDDTTNDVDARESKEIKPDSPLAIVIIEMLESGSQLYFVRRSGIVSFEEAIILDKIENGPLIEGILAMRVIGLCVYPCSMRDLKQVEDLFFSLNGTSRMSFDVKNIAEWEMIKTEKDVTTLTREKHCIIYIHDPWA